MAAPKTKTDPVARREELRTELEAARQYTVKARADIAALVAKHGSSSGNNRLRVRQREIADTHIAIARGQADEGDLARAKDALAQAERDLGAATERNEVANRARSQVRSEIAALHNAEAEAFVEAAGPLTDAAHEALDAVREAYEHALAAWARAAGEWEPLTDDVPELGSVPSCPLPPVEQVFGIRECRPPQLWNGAKIADLTA